MGVMGMELQHNEKVLLLALSVTLIVVLVGVWQTLAYSIAILAVYGVLRALYVYRQYLYQVQAEKPIQSDMVRLANDVQVPIDQLSSIGISGMPGSGKSTYATYLLAQVTGIPIYVLDIHYPDQQSLGARIEREGILVKIYSDIEAIEDHLSDMREGITVIDEYTSLLRQKPTLKSKVLDYVQQGRKYGCYIWLIGQHWSSKSVGGTEIRDSLVAFAALRQRVKDGRMSTGVSDIPDTGKLKHSEVLLVVYGSGIQAVYTYDSKLITN
jgi:hypothetical protein